MTPLRPCIERIPDGRGGTVGCARYAVNGARCEEHQRAKNRRHYERVSPGTTVAWAKQRMRVKRRDGHRCRHCGVKEQKVNGRSNLQVHHVKGSEPGSGGSIRTPTEDRDLITLCTRCHGIETKAIRDAKLMTWQR